MIQRHIESALDHAIKHFPCTILTGPRQVGKSTLLTQRFKDRGFSYVTLDDMATKMLAKNDPKTFLSIHPSPLIIEQAQKAVELFDELAHLINEKRVTEGNAAANGMYILSLSSRRDLLERAKESLAGRAAILEMAPLSLSEILGRANFPFVPDALELFKRSGAASLSQDGILDLIVKGGLPELYDDEGLRGPIFYSSFISAYLEKDVKEQIDLKDETKFYNFLTLVASLTGQELIYDNLSKQIGVSAATIKAWISILAKTGVVHLLEPYFEQSWTKRVVKAPKIYFFDTGIACYLLGIDSKQTLSRSFLKGRLFETFVVNEIRKTHENAGEKTPLFYYRDYAQKEVDIVFVKNGRIHCLECKFGQEHTLGEVSSFKELEASEYEKGKGAIICTADALSALSDSVLVIPVKAI